MSMLIDTLLKEGLINREQLEDAKDKQLGAKKPVHDLLVEMGFLKEEELIKISSKVFGTPVIELDNKTIDPSAVKLLPYEKAKKYGVFPVRKEGNELILAMSDPCDVITIDDIGLITNMQVKPMLSTKSQINACVDTYYQMDDTLYDLLKNIVTDTKIELVKEAPAKGKGVDLGVFQGEQSPVIKLVNLIIGDAVKSRASDIHIEPQEVRVDVRYRIDGYLKSIMKVPKELFANLVARIKILAELDIAETRKPQDGRTRILFNGRTIDLRISVMPTFYGEKVVLRLLDRQEAKTDLDKVGFEPEELNIFKEAAKKPQGIVLTTGPTGSGKTTTLYAALCFTKTETKNIITIEDPIEYLIEGINQTQVNVIKNVTFANGLRSILRQDPDVVLVGEIRDKDTAEIAFRASLTGHLVFSTLHTNDAISSIVRLRDIGLEPYLIASSLSLVAAQRLVRIICPYCKQEYTPSEKHLDKFKKYIDKLGVKKFYRGAGCEKCDFAGFSGRTAIFEVIKINEEIRNLISSKAPEDFLLKGAIKSGMVTLAEAGIKKVAEGITTLEEAANVITVVEEEVKEKPPEERVAKPVPVEKKQKLLVVDDEDDIRKILGKRLETAGYDVVMAKNGQEGVENAIREKPDLIVMDVMMPVMNGFEATKALRSKLETAVIPIVMLTAKKDKESELAGLDAGADDYITKPFDSDKLLARVKMLLRRKR